MLRPRCRTSSHLKPHCGRARAVIASAIASPEVTFPNDQEGHVYDLWLVIALGDQQAAVGHRLLWCRPIAFGQAGLSVGKEEVAVLSRSAGKVEAKTVEFLAQGGLDDGTVLLHLVGIHVDNGCGDVGMQDFEEGVAEGNAINERALPEIVLVEGQQAWAPFYLI